MLTEILIGLVEDFIKLGSDIFGSFVNHNNHGNQDVNHQQYQNYQQHIDDDCKF